MADEPWKCGWCGDTWRVATEDRYPYQPFTGLEITLSKIPVNRCGGCRRHMARIPDQEELDRQIAACVIRQRTRLTGPQVRFLHRHLRDDRGYIPNGTDLAAMMGVDKTTVTRWVTGAKPIGPQADRLLRLMVALSLHDKRYPIATLVDVALDSAKPEELVATRKKGIWHVEPASRPLTRRSSGTRS